MKTSTTCSYEAAEKSQNQSAAATSIGDSADSLAHVFSTSGSEDFSFGDLPQHFQSLTLPSDARPGKRTEALDLEPCTNDADSSWNTNRMQVTQYDGALGEARALAAFGTAQASSSHTTIADCSIRTLRRFSQAPQQNLMARPPGNVNFNYHNASPLRSLPCVPIQQSAQNSQITSTSCTTNIPGNNHDLAPSHLCSQQQAMCF